MMPAGKYYVGDLCYVMNDDEWDQVCSVTIVDNKCIDGEFNLPDGRRFAMYGTAWGDGVYKDLCDREFSVDSGTIGCIKVDDIKTEKYEHIAELGNFIDFDSDFVTYGSRKEGVIQFGRIHINTDPDCDDEY